MSDDGELHKLGDVLRAAREQRGVELARVERDTKIRSRYLSALERGEYRELPGAVYTKGFLRNYGSYLGLDTDYLVDLYRLEAADAIAERAPAPVPPRPMAARKARALVVTPGVIVGLVLTVLVGVFVVYFVSEFVTFARTPALRITEPAGDVAAYDQLTYTFRGQTEPNSRVTVQGARENPTVTADADGNFSIEIDLVPGSNLITLVANDPLTGRDSDPVERRIVVGGEEPSPGATPDSALAISGPEQGATVSGPLRVVGTGRPGERLRVQAQFRAEAPPTFEIKRPDGSTVRLPSTPPKTPAPQSVTVDDQGVFDVRLNLGAGTWRITVTAEDREAAASRRVRVAAPQGLGGTLRVEGGVSYLEVDEDGDAKEGISGRNATPGTSVKLSAIRAIRIRAGNAGAVELTINGIDLGTMGGSGSVVEWQIARL